MELKLTAGDAHINVVGDGLVDGHDDLIAKISCGVGQVSGVSGVSGVSAVSLELNGRVDSGAADLSQVLNC